MTAHLPESASVWSLAANMMPPRDPNDDDEDEDGNVNGDESEDEEPAVIREPDE
jgi:hypothetical protein